MFEIFFSEAHTGRVGLASDKRLRQFDIFIVSYNSQYKTWMIIGMLHAQQRHEHTHTQRYEHVHRKT